MRRTRKYLAVYFCCLVFFCNIFCLNVYGFDKELYTEAVASGDFSSKNPILWVQNGAIPPGQDSKTFVTEQFGEKVTYTYGQAACTYISHYYMLIRAGLKNPNTDGTFVDFMDELLTGPRSEEFISSGGGFFPAGETITSFFPSVKCVDTEFCEDGMEPFMSFDELTERTKAAYERGNYVVAYLRVGSNSGTAGTNTGADSGHAVFLEGVDSRGKLIAFDASNVGKDITNYPMFTRYNGGDTSKPICYYYVEYSVEGVMSMDTLTLWDRFSEGSSGDFINTEANINNTEVKEKAQLVWKLGEERVEGFTKENLLAVSQIAIQTEPVEIEGIEEARLEQLTNNIKGDSFDMEAFLKSLSVVIGMLFCLYSLFLFLALLLDLIMPVVRLQFVNIISFKKLYFIASIGERPINHEFKYVTWVQVVGICLGLFTLGILIATGTLYGLLDSLLTWVLTLC